MRALWSGGPERRAKANSGRQEHAKRQDEGGAEEVTWSDTTLFAVWAEGEVMIGNVECEDKETAWVVLWHPYPLREAMNKRDVRSGKWNTKKMFKTLGPLYFDNHDGHYCTVNNAIRRNNNVQDPVRCEMAVRYERGHVLLELHHSKGKLTQESIAALEELLAGEFTEQNERKAASKCQWRNPGHRGVGGWERVAASIKARGIKPYLCWEDEGSGIDAAKNRGGQKKGCKREEGKGKEKTARVRAARMVEEVDEELGKGKNKDSDEELEDFVQGLEEEAC